MIHNTNGSHEGTMSVFPPMFWSNLSRDFLEFLSLDDTEYQKKGGLDGICYSFVHCSTPFLKSGLSA